MYDKNKKHKKNNILNIYNKHDDNHADKNINSELNPNAKQFIPINNIEHEHIAIQVAEYIFK